MKILGHTIAYLSVMYGLSVFAAPASITLQCKGQDKKTPKVLRWQIEFSDWDKDSGYQKQLFKISNQVLRLNGDNHRNCQKNSDGSVNFNFLGAFDLRFGQKSDDFDAIATLKGHCSNSFDYDLKGNCIYLK